MSVNLHLAVRISGYDPARSDAIRQAVQAVVEQEQLERDLPPLAESGEGADRALVSQTDPDFPVPVSRSYEWLPEMQTRFAKAAEQANGRPCQVEFEGEDADEGDDDEEDEDDDDDFDDEDEDEEEDK
jgi:hypothetical protein